MDIIKNSCHESFPITFIILKIEKVDKISVGPNKIVRDLDTPFEL